MSDPFAPLSLKELEAVKSRLQEHLEPLDWDVRFVGYRPDAWDEPDDEKHVWIMARKKIHPLGSLSFYQVWSNAIVRRDSCWKILVKQFVDVEDEMVEQRCREEAGV